MCSSDDVFVCPRHAGGLRLTPVACAAMWRRGRNADPLDAVASCKGCQIGAGHAGEANAPLEPSPGLCVRCGSTGRRMIHSRGVCVSCYNREREIARGADRRGKPPRKPAQVPILAVDISGRPVRRQAAGRVELTLWALRNSAVGAVVSRYVLRGSPVQAALWPGCWR